MLLYHCSDCKYKTQKKYNFDCHIKSKKHHQNVVKCNNDENNKYLCELCNYSTKLYSNFTKHLNTKKHLTKKSQENETPVIKITEKMFSEMISCNKQLMEVIQNGTNHITNNNCHNTNTFNLNFFLNETCKDAINMKDFIESIDVSIMDLKRLGNKGYVEGISSLMIDKLNELNVTKRPIHSTDSKRNSIYIKDDNVWEKDDNEKMKSILWDVTRLETRALEDKYKIEYPKCETDRDSKEHQEYWRIFYNAMGGKGDIDDLKKKVIKKIAQNVAIDKTKLY